MLLLAVVGCWLLCRCAVVGCWLLGRCAVVGCVVVYALNTSESFPSTNTPPTPPTIKQAPTSSSLLSCVRFWSHSGSSRTGRGRRCCTQTHFGSCQEATIRYVCLVDVVFAGVGSVSVHARWHQGACCVGLCMLLYYCTNTQCIQHHIAHALKHNTLRPTPRSQHRHRLSR